MKKIISLVFTLFFITLLFAQSIPNNSFEQWIDHGSYMEPQAWHTLNPYSQVFNSIGVTRSTDAYDGNYSVQLETTEIIGLYTIPGLITFADLNIDFINGNYSYSGGLSISQRVTSMSGMFKYTGVDNDSAVVLFYNFKNNGGQRDTIGTGYTFLHNTNAWTKFTVTMEYKNNNIPDTLNILFLSSGNAQAMHIGSKLLVDSLALQTNTGIISLPYYPLAVKTYPNPAFRSITFETKKPDNDRIINVFDIAGKLVERFAFPQKKSTFKIDKLTIGTYFFDINKSGKILSIGKFIKK